MFEARIHYNSGIFKNQIRFYRTHVFKKTSSTSKNANQTSSQEVDNYLKRLTAKEEAEKLPAKQRFDSFEKASQILSSTFDIFNQNQELKT